MKKKILSTLIAFTLLGGTLASCNNKVDDSSKDYGPAPATFKLSDYYEGVIGNQNSATPDQNYKIKKSGKATIRGYFTMGGDGNYTNKHCGYIKPMDGGDPIYIFGYDNSVKDKVATDLVPGALVDLTGEIAMNQAMPQLTNYTYNLLEAAPAYGSDEYNTLMGKLFTELSDDEVAKVAMTKDLAYTSDMNLQSIKLSNMVNIEDVSKGSTAKLVPLKYLGTENEAQYTVQLYRPDMTTTIKKGTLIDVYAGVTQYKGAFQLHVGNIQETPTRLNGLQVKADGTLSDADKLALTKIRVQNVGDGVSYDFDEKAEKDTLLQPNGDRITLSDLIPQGVTVEYSVPTEYDYIAEITSSNANANLKRLAFKKDIPFGKLYDSTVPADQQKKAATEGEFSINAKITMNGQSIDQAIKVPVKFIDKRKPLSLDFNFVNDTGKTPAGVDLLEKAKMQSKSGLSLGYSTSTDGIVTGDGFTTRHLSDEATKSYTKDTVQDFTIKVKSKDKPYKEGEGNFTVNIYNAKDELVAIVPVKFTVKDNTEQTVTIALTDAMYSTTVTDTTFSRLSLVRNADTKDKEIKKNENDKYSSYIYVTSFVVNNKTTK